MKLSGGLFIVSVALFTTVFTFTLAGRPKFKNACGVTPNPSYCESLVTNLARSPADYVLTLVQESLDQSALLSSLISQTMRDVTTAAELSSSSPAPRRSVALEDCLLLSGLTTDFLLSTSIIVKNSGHLASIPHDQVDRVHTLLSATITNQQTCYDGLNQANLLKSSHTVYEPLLNGSQLYSISLAMFTHYLVPPTGNRPSRNRQLLDELTVQHGVPKWLNQSVILGSPSQRRRALAMRANAVVAQDGSSNYRTIGEAIAATPMGDENRNGYFVIHVKAGVYPEYVTIGKKKKYIMVVGDGIGKTVITGGRSVGDGATTFSSATLGVLGEGFVAIGITVRNTARPAKGQAVAVRNGADLSAFYQCSFEGYQDTLYAYALRQFYRECDIYGTVDFIFGNAAAVFQNCNIYVRHNGNINTITAQGRSDRNQNTGTSIIGCNILSSTEASAGRSTARTYLGRPWRPYARTVVMNSNLGSLIDPSGWAPWDSASALSTLYYGEYNNRGPGSDTSRRVKWPGFHLMNANDANGFTVSNLVQGDAWLPKTSVPFAAGLV